MDCFYDNLQLRGANYKAKSVKFAFFSRKEAFELDKEERAYYINSEHRVAAETP